MAARTNRRTAPPDIPEQVSEMLRDDLRAVRDVLMSDETVLRTLRLAKPAKCLYDAHMRIIDALEELGL